MFCGFVGNATRSEYAVVGGAVNLAARLMGTAAKLQAKKRKVEAAAGGGGESKERKGETPEDAARRAAGAILCDAATKVRAEKTRNESTGRKFVFYATAPVKAKERSGLSYN